MASVLTNRNLKSVLLLLSSTIFLVACGDDSPSPQSDLVSESEVSNISEADIAIDTGIKAQVELALENASDLPPGFTVAVSEGVVLISGSVVCEDCGGMRTPGNIGTVQQSLGGVVRAVPGVMRVDFDLSYGSD